MTTHKFETTSYHIPSSTITLTINRRPLSLLSKSDTTTCLDNVRNIAKENPEGAMLEQGFHYHKSSSGVRFAIGPAIFLQELTWGDVLGISGGLLDYFNETGIWAATNFWIEDKERGALGDGLVWKAEVVREPVKSDNETGTP